MLQCAYKSLRISTLRLKDSEIAAGDVVALCAMQEYIPSSFSLRLLIVSLLSICSTPGSSDERNPLEVAVTTLYL